VTWAVLEGDYGLAVIDSEKTETLKCPATIDETDRTSLKLYLDSLEQSNPGGFRALQRAVNRNTTGWTWSFSRHTFELSNRVLIMGILNCTPDSFYDGGKFDRIDIAIEQAERMISNGADIIDIGGESTRPESTPISIRDELDRILPVIKNLSKRNYLLSIDTRNATVAEAAIQEGVSIINNVAGFRDHAMVDLMARTDAGGVIMHMQGDPSTMQASPSYTWATGEIALFLAHALDALNDAGVNEQRLVIDPGIGFGKTLDHNLELFRNMTLFRGLGRPILVGASRKSFIGGILDLPVEHRLEGSIAAAVVAAINGARIVRVHDVKETVRAIRVAETMM